MKPKTENRNWHRARRIGFCFLHLLLCSQAGIFADDFRPENVFATPVILSPYLQRVAVLPLAAAGQGADLPEGCDVLNSILQDELVKTKKFEVVAVSPEVLRHRTGHPAWTGAETLPPDFFGSLRRVYGCDAVLFAELTTFHAYAPLVVGWRLKLVDARSQSIIWEADEVFDASQPQVASGAKHFQRREHLPANDWAMLNSPRQFGRFSAATLLACLPGR